MKSFFVLHTDWDQHPLEPDQEDAFQKRNVKVVRLTSRSPDEFLQHAPTADAILNSDFRLFRDLILALKRCRVISRYGSGVDNIDVEAATSMGIPVANVVGFCTDEVADRTLVLLLAAACNIPFLDRFCREGKWGLKHLPFSIELRGKTLGLIGFGKIGRSVAERAKKFGLKVIAYDPDVNAGFMRDYEVEWAELDPLITSSDFLSAFAADPWNKTPS